MYIYLAGKVKNHYQISIAIAAQKPEHLLGYLLTITPPKGGARSIELQSLDENEIAGEVNSFLNATLSAEEKDKYFKGTLDSLMEAVGEVAADAFSTNIQSG